ncbi:MAG TPA: hypothetical protein VHX87_09055 [Galbitalea sp.]|jgi:hypothetical protein|nr:hypothetical protein [Galbitalea sp.]
MSASPSPQAPSRRTLGIGRVLITVYAILAIGATSRAVFQIAEYWSTTSARLPITLSAVSGVIYVLATVALIAPGRAWYRVAWVTISFELAGVLIIGTLSLVDGALFAGPAHTDVSDGTVWSYYGVGYLFIPVALPILGLLWLRSRRRVMNPVGA